MQRCDNSVFMQGTGIGIGIGIGKGMYKNIKGDIIRVMCGYVM